MRRKTECDAFGGKYMAKEKKSNRYLGVYYRDLDNGDRSYFLRVRLGGGTKRIPIGKRSEGITEAFCNQEKARIVNAHRFGDDVASKPSANTNGGSVPRGILRS
jgi:hypothetical protein